MNFPLFYHLVTNSSISIVICIKKFVQFLQHNQISLNNRLACELNETHTHGNLPTDNKDDHIFSSFTVTTIIRMNQHKVFGKPFYYIQKLLFLKRSLLSWKSSLSNMKMDFNTTTPNNIFIIINEQNQDLEYKSMNLKIYTFLKKLISIQYRVSVRKNKRILATVQDTLKATDQNAS